LKIKNPQKQKSKLCVLACFSIYSYTADDE